MKLKFNIFLLLFIVFSLFSYQKTFAQCFQIESILVAACTAQSSASQQEGLNEMVRFVVGDLPLDAKKLTVVWPVAAAIWKGVIQNATSAAKVAQLNADILAAGGGGKLLEPSGGIVPAGATVILVTSYNMNTVSNSFGALADTIYIIFQNNPANVDGHISNEKNGTLKMSFSGGADCSDKVDIVGNNLVKNSGGKTSGATVNFDSNGNATYVNNGCVAPVEVFTVDAGTTPISGCPGSKVSLSGTAQGQQSVAWSASSGSFSAPTSLSTDYTIPEGASGSITVTLSATNAAGTIISDTVTLNVNSGTSPTVASVSYCQGSTAAPLTANPSSATLNWYGTSATGGTASAIAPTPSTVLAGPTTYYVSQTIGTCESARVPITVTINSTPSLQITNQSIGCGVASVDLAGAAVTAGSTGGGVLSYYTDLAATTLLTNPNAVGVGIYYIKSTSGTCFDIEPVEVTSVGGAIPTPTVITPVEYCQNSTPSALTATALGGATLNWYGTNQTGGTASSIAPTPTVTALGSTTYYVSQKVGSCESTRVAIVVTVSNSFTGKVVNLFCDNANSTTTSVAFDWNNPNPDPWAGYYYSYSIAGGPLVTGFLVSPSHFDVPVTTLGISVTFTILSVKGNPCIPSVSATCNAKCLTSTTPNFPIIAPICTGSTAPILEPTSPNGITGTWSPATVSNTATGSYEFTPDAVLFPCASKVKKEVVVVPLNDAGIVSGNQNICGVGTTTLTSTVSGGSWNSLNPTIATVNATGIVTGVSAGIATIEYTVTGSGVCPPNKKTYTVTITAPSSAGVLGGGPDVCQGQSILFTSTVSGGTWSSLDTAIATVNSVSGSALGISAGTALIKYTVKGTNGCLDAESTLPIKVTALLNAGIISGNQNICIGSTTSFTSTVSGGTWTSLDTAIAAVDATGLVTAVSAGSTKIVYTVNSTGICPSAKEERTITVNPKRTPSFNTIGSICKGNNITLPTTSINNITGSWSPPFNPLATTTYTFIPDAGQCATSTPINQIVTIIQLPVATATSGPISICSGGSTFIDLTADIPGTGTTFSWNVVQTNATGSTAGSGSRIEPNLTTTGNKFGEAVYSITPNNSGCKGKSIEVTITVNPIPDVKVNTEKSTICSGTSTNILLTSGVVGTTYTWTVNATPNVVVAPLLGNTNLIQQQLVTNDLTQGSVVYTITPDSNGCPGTAIDVTITVDPLPDGTALVANYTICSGKATEIDLSSTIGASFNWTVIQTGVTGATSGTGVSIEQTLQAGTVAGTVEYIITPLLNGCEGSPNPVIINVNPLPVAVIQEDGLLCIRKDGTLKSSFVLNTNLSNTDYDFVWYQDNIAIPPPLFPLLPPTSSYEVTEIGDYYVAITNKLTTCYAESNSALITSISPADYIDPPIVTDAFTDNATVIINVFPPADYYLYQMDFGPLQDFNEFTKVKGGSHIIRVTDAIGCTDLRTPARVISYPKFFTPNGDGYNDTWNINDLEDQPNAKLYIFDRHGKLLKQVSTFGNGWDGTYNGKQLPASDYWFTINYFEDNVLKLFKSHFTLKR